jgi:Zn-dependent protease with chaperone function
MKRHGFVTIWLWVGLIIYVLSAFVFFYGSRIAEVPIIYMFMGVFSILGCVSFLLLLNWKIIGFWISCILSVMGVFINILFGEFLIDSVINGVIRTIILYCILKIKKNGISTWDYLNNENEILSDNINKKCKSCHHIYSKVYNLCTNCGSPLYELTNKTEKNESISLGDNIWVCKKCSEKNNINDIFCKGCGYYK